MTYGHLRADCLYTGISSGPNARYRVWESLYLYLLVWYQLWLSICPSVCHKPVFYQNGSEWINLVWHAGYPQLTLLCVEREFGYLQSKVTSI